MQNDLISRSAVISLLGSSTEPNGKLRKVEVYDLKKQIKDIPTAYSVESVVAELEEKLEQPWIPLLAKNGYYNAIEIVRNGGKE